MRYVQALVALGCLAALGGCGYTPKQLGITGPGSQQISLPSQASEESQDALIPEPGLSSGMPDRYAPTMVPTYGSNGRYYGYN